ncbi:MAG: hypothetical protein A3I01_01040 [Betaproteobacteria bacterium RIFCSPLOWO2_02_FULL_65_24]|nr:MAG: hypothetical protein A3I01_01040 [Betaproteobacteria bacterium RIFCSPLOWO2_02_FULL_65_24]
MAFSFTETVTPIRTKDERLFKDLGARVAHLSKDKRLTQTQLAERMGIAHQTLAQAAHEEART